MPGRRSEPELAHIIASRRVLGTERCRLALWLRRMPPKKDDKKSKSAAKSGGGGGKAKKKVRVYLPTTTHQPVHVVGVSTAAKRGWEGRGGRCAAS